MADVKQTKIGDIFQGSVFNIPRYQRGYSWGELQINDLLQDINYTFEQRRQSDDNEFSHYFGTVVLLDKGVRQTEASDYNKFDVIDGQQRLTTISILMSVVTEELEEISEDELWKNYSVPPSKLADDYRQEFVSKYDEDRVVLDDINNTVFAKITKHNDPIDTINTTNITQRRLIDAKEIIQEWFENRREENRDEEGNLDDYYSYLRNFGKIVENGLEITTYKIDDETEAGRLFEVVNDRGKDLTSLDKIKSYLVYCAARIDDKNLSVSVYQRMGDVVRNITENGGGDEAIETFVRYHWMLFTGELVLARQSDSEYTEVHRRIKNLPKHASLSQDDEYIRTWIKFYLSSAVSCSEGFEKIRNPSQIDADNEYAREIIDRLDGLSRLPVSNNFLPLLMATYHRFGISEEFRNMVSLCEKLSFRVYNLAGRRTDAGRAALQRHGYWIEWAGMGEKAKQVFNDDEKSLKFSSKQEAIPETAQRIESEIGENSPDTYFLDCLMRDDIIEGSDRNDGWRGVRNNDAIRYLLYRYEKHLRDSGSNSSISQIPPFSQWKDEGITIEHIHPQNPEEADESLADVTNKLGNLVLLGPEDNSIASNADYTQKYEQVYSTSSMLSLQELPSSEDGWDEEQISERTRSIANFALSEWGNLSKAHVHVRKSPIDIDDVRGLREIAHSVRTDYRNQSGFTAPSIHLQQKGVNGDTWKRIRGCPACGSSRVDIESTDGWDAVCAGCSEQLDDPVYKFRGSDYIEKKN